MMLLKTHVKAAHLVPGSLTEEGLAYLFGVGEIALRSPKQ